MGLAAREVRAIADVAGAIAQESLHAVQCADGQHVRSFYLLWPPGQTDLGFLDALVSMPGAYRRVIS